MDDLKDWLGGSQTEDYYGILGVRVGASESEIQKAHYRMALAWHPDRHRGSLEATEHFKLIQRAADVLRDPEARYDYDMQECIHRLAAEDYIDRAGPCVALTASGLGLLWQSPGEQVAASWCLNHHRSFGGAITDTPAQSFANPCRQQPSGSG